MSPANVYHPDEFLLGISSVRERCFKVQEIANRNQLSHFDVDKSKLDDMIHLVISLIKRDYDNPSDILPFGRWRHFDTGNRPRIQNLLNTWSSLGQDALEQTRKLIDLFVVACLLDIDPYQAWSYVEPITGRTYRWKDGVAVAIFDMFCSGTFSSDPAHPHRVDSEGLLNLSADTIFTGLQITQKNYLAGLEERLDVLTHLGTVLHDRTDFFGNGVQRPGNLVDYLIAHPNTIQTRKGPLISIETIWPVVQEMGELWAAESEKGGTLGLGDVWSCKTLLSSTNSFSATEHLVPFHKSSQWLVYSIIEPMEKLLGATIEGSDLLTALPDCWNGGLLMDTGFLTLKPKEYERGIQNYHNNSLLPSQPKIEIVPMFELSDPVVIEWRALTVAYLDLVAERVRHTLKLSRKALSLSQLIQGGTSSAGRELAEISRPNTHEPPIVIKAERGILF